MKSGCKWWKTEERGAAISLFKAHFSQHLSTSAPLCCVMPAPDRLRTLRICLRNSPKKSGWVCGGRASSFVILPERIARTYVHVPLCPLYDRAQLFENVRLAALAHTPGEGTCLGASSRRKVDDHHVVLGSAMIL